jgi:WD40 repeat protein|tara:strand:- start:250 stop:642 length:393 start_codon:yes stop_codon:yes gene_type:complete
MAAKGDASPEPRLVIKGPKDHIINDIKWGALDKSLYYATDKGRLLQYDLNDQSMIRASDIHRNEIFSITMSYDQTMLFTCSRDGFCKLIHPETFDTIREFNYSFPCRNAAISPLFDATDNQKFHVLLCGG